MIIPDIVQYGALFACSIAFPLWVSRSRRSDHHYHRRRRSEGPRGCIKPCYVSSPGKVLVAGGYLVLERENIGITIATNARFFVRTELYNHPPGGHAFSTQTSDNLSMVVFEFVSPQFHKTCVYSFDFNTCATLLVSGDENVFIFRSLQTCCLYARGLLGAEAAAALARLLPPGERRLRVELMADNDFYSQIEELERRNLPLLSSSLLELPKFLPCPINGDDGSVRVSKTGLGSSAAMTTALCGALLHTMGCVDLLATNNKLRIDDYYRCIHNVAQLAHAIAQGKVGSGFDVSSAVYGTQIYQRFDPENVNRAFEMMNALDISPVENAAQIFDLLNDESVWTQRCTRFQLPPGLDIVLGDVCGGSSSSSMAKSVLSWRKKSPVEANEVWSTLAAANNSIAVLFDRLSDLASRNPGDFRLAEGLCAANPWSKWASIAENDDATDLEREVVRTFCDLKKQFGISRRTLREMGHRAGVEIEPAQQTALCDASEALPGVLCAGVPGAGGVDAVYAITLGNTARSCVEAMWSDWWRQEGASCKVCPLVLSADKSPVSGIRIEV